MLGFRKMCAESHIKSNIENSNCAFGQMRANGIKVTEVDNCIQESFAVSGDIASNNELLEKDTVE